MSKLFSHGDVMRSVAHAGRVKRYHTWPTLHHETVAEHSWRVATLYMEIFEPDPSGAVLKHLLMHDCGELYAGDVPHHSKANVPELKTLIDEVEARGLTTLGVTLPPISEAEEANVRTCDLLQMYEFALIEIYMGNQYAHISAAGVEKALVAHVGVVRTTELMFYVMSKVGGVSD